jgi:hypothetical protein
LSIPTAGLCGVGAVVGIILGILALRKANESPAEFGGRGLALGGIITSAVSVVVAIPLGIILAIAIPSFLRARMSAGEAGVIGDVRTVISAEFAYASANGGFFDSLECLAAPSDCLPDSPAGGPTFLGPEFLTPIESGYERTFHPGPPVFPEPGAAVSPSSVTSFAYVAVPVRPGETGVRGFCGDSSGRICFTSDGSAPPVFGGQCEESCNLLQ